MWKHCLRHIGKSVDISFYPGIHFVDFYVRLLITLLVFVFGGGLCISEACLLYGFTYAMPKDEHNSDGQ